ncbi:Uncharacterised protein [Serratia fonticola]|nr:Uncharacterised protein [Serratia fonticola]
MNRNAMLMVAILLTIAIADYSYEKNKDQEFVIYM